MSSVNDTSISIENKVVNSNNIEKNRAILLAVLAAAFYAVSTPCSKILLKEIPSAMLAALLYLGAGTGLLTVEVVKRKFKKVSKELPLTRKDMPYTVAMVVLDIAAPIFLMIGLNMTTAANVSLLNNFEIVATAVIALAVYKESISKKLWIGIFLVTLSSVILSVEDVGSFSFSAGSIFVLMACVCWGFENNCTRQLSAKNPVHIVIIKGLFSGAGSFIISLFLNEVRGSVKYIILALLVGFVAYGLSISFYIYAQRTLGAAKTSAYYAVSPFIGAALSFLLFKDVLKLSFCVALVIMIGGTYFASAE